MDEFDARLLNLMQENNRLTAEKLSALVGLSPAACQKRLKRLRENGTIAHDISVLSPEATGRKLTLIVEVTMNGKGRKSWTSSSGPCGPRRTSCNAIT